MDFIFDKIADRLGGRDFENSTKLYKFAKIKIAKAEARMKNPGIALIDMGVGEPDIPADGLVAAILSQEAKKAENRWYSDNGIPEFQEAAARYLKKVYGLNNVDPYKNIIHGIGSKPILAMIPLMFINPGDITLATIPGYPVISTYTQYLGGEAYNLPLHRENDFYPGFSDIPHDILKRAKLLYINYPNNPTGQVATEEFYKRVVEFAYKNNIVVISDAAYGALVYGDNKPLSFLSVDGAWEVGLEIHSLSKAFNMTGWRLAFAVGNSKLMEAYGIVKNNTDSGQFRAIQKAGIYALDHTEITEHNCRRYSRRFDLLIDALKEVGFDAVKPKGSFYCYVPCPKRTKSGIVFSNAEEVSDYLIRQALVSTVPWDDAGAYLRFSVTFEASSENEEKTVIEEMKTRLKRLEFLF
ncbi:MAG: LL-diaminopimelate aminotransferase [Clostridia bacterium]|nr:LL-diaminopimelate aminotransferase [Clostridia bacterium]